MALVLRPYQEEAHERISAELKRHRDTLLCLPTGTGKTFTAASWINDNDLSTLWLAHRTELVDQAYKAFKSLGARVSKWTADEKDASGNIVVSTVLSTKGLEDELPEVDLMVCDEAHHWPMASYSGPTGIKNRIKANKLLGLTATPTRLDKKDLGFTSIAYQRSFLDMVAAGWLAIPNYVKINTRIKLGLTKHSGDFTQKSLAAVNNRARNQVIRTYVNENREALGKILVFAANVEHANELAGDLEGVPITQLTSDRDRRERIRKFRSGDIQLLVNCMIFTEGFDAPDINTVILARPTASKALYMQMIGRGSRTAPDKKKFNIVDVVDSDRHYSILAHQWSREELGDGLNIEEAAARRTRVKKYLEDNSLDLKDVCVKFNISDIDIAGLMRYTLYDGSKEVMPLNTSQVEALMMWEEHIKNERKLDKQLIYTTYSVYGSPTGFRLTTWKAICWAMWHTLKDGREAATLVLFCGDYTIKSKNGAQSILLDEILRVNTEMANRGDEVWQEITDKLGELVSLQIASTIAGAQFKYVNGVFEIVLGVPFNKLRYFLPARLVIRELANEILDTEIVEVAYALK